MASVFTYDPDPPRVSSPWLTPRALTPKLGAVDDRDPPGDGGRKISASLENCGITKLEAEPQEGPTEYKLHLLLRPRRSFTTSTTRQQVSGSYQSRSRASRSSDSSLLPRLERGSATPPPTVQSRQNRLQHLTTQLLWRLQQSSPYHSSSSTNLVLPSLIEDVSKLNSLSKPGKLLPGLEESQGALYEIGVSDDGTLVGLTKDEMEESLMNLRAMAASLGCKVQVLRNVIVGECEWIEESLVEGKICEDICKDKLWVAEAFVVPNIRLPLPVSNGDPNGDQIAKGAKTKQTLYNNRSAAYLWGESQTQQLRVSLTGSTTSGKSSLLGTLSTSTLDNGRGKSRLSLLKHRHEIASGVTSSVAPELIGYERSTYSGSSKKPLKIVNYSSGNVSAWTDIHNAAEGGRLVFLADSAGHPRYRRTTVRGLISWAPHWTICCIAADNDEDTSGKIGATASARDVLGINCAGIDLSKAHLELCLKLGLPLVVVITKYDLASRTPLKQTLAKVLSSVKAFGRQPRILTADEPLGLAQDIQVIPSSAESVVRKFLSSCPKADTGLLVPIVLTSSVTGAGIGTLHALLHQLPILSSLKAPDDRHTSLNSAASRIVFHIDEVYTKAPSTDHHEQESNTSTTESSYVVSGHLRYGQINVGDEVLIGPFAPEITGDQSGETETFRPSSFPGQFDTPSPSTPPPRTRLRPRSGDYVHPSKLSRSEAQTGDQWLTIRVVSLRNLRLPVRALLQGQVGTIGISFKDALAYAPIAENNTGRKLRKGMILTQCSTNSVDGVPSACTGFFARFEDGLASSLLIGAEVVVYVASVRASVRVVSLEASTPPEKNRNANGSEPDSVFDFDDDDDDDVDGGVNLSTAAEEVENGRTTVSFQFVTYREWIETGTKVLVMPGNSTTIPNDSERGEKLSMGLDGFVGEIIQVIT